MSKKKFKKQRQQTSFPWVLVLFGGFLLLAAGFVLFTRNDGGGTPSIAVDQQKIDYGDVKFNTPKTFAVKVTNTGSGALRFQGAPYIEVLEGC